MLMGKLVCGAILLLAAAQAGCATSPPVRPGPYVDSLEPVQPTCDTSVAYVDLVGRYTNRTGGEVVFQLDDFEGPPFDPVYMAYRVYAGEPGERMQLVHNSGHDSKWDRTVTIARGESTTLHVPIFGLRPSDYYRYFRIEYRDSRNRSYWTREFTLCAVAPANCRCPAQATTMGAGANPARLACPLATSSSPVQPGVREISLMCR
jgi:hypothetical protein